MNFHIQTLNMPKALHTSVQYEANWWAWPEIYVVLCNSLNNLFISWFPFFKQRLHFLRFPIAFWIIVCPENIIMIDKPAMFTVNILIAVAYLILKTSYSAM